MMGAVSIRELALRAVKDALSGYGSPAANVFRSKLNTITQADLPCYDITPDEEKLKVGGEWGDRLTDTRTLTVIVRSIIDAATQEGEDTSQSSSAPVDDSGLDPYYVFAVNALTGDDANLNGAVLDVVEVSSKTVFQPGGRDFIGLETTFEIEFATKRGDPTQKG